MTTWQLRADLGSKYEDIETVATLVAMDVSIGDLTF